MQTRHHTWMTPTSCRHSIVEPAQRDVLVGANESLSSGRGTQVSADSIADASVTSQGTGSAARRFDRVRSGKSDATHITAD
jgi:hypothetical protein